MKEEDFNQFIRFGRIKNHQYRKELINYLLDIIQNNNTTCDSKFFEEMRPYIQVISEVLKTPNLKNLCQENQNIFQDISKNLIDTFESVDKNVSLNNSYNEEELCFNKWSNTQLAQFFTYDNAIFSDISKFYTNQEFNLPFFQQELKRLNSGVKKTVYQKKEALRREMLERWNAFLTKKKNEYFLKKLDEERTKLCKQLYEQIKKFRELQKILQPFTNECGRLWDLSKGSWQRVGFDILEQYAKLMQKEKELQKLAEYLGRVHQTEDELEEEEIKETIIKPQHIFIHAGKSELVGIHESNDLNNLLPSELCLLNDQISELVFYKKFAEKKLLTYQFIGYDWMNKEIEKNKTQFVPKKNKRGPIIICVDTSGSMEGVPEYVAKVMCFAILRIALLEKRSCFLISFSTAIQTLEITDFNKSLNTLIDFLTFSFHGGTDAIPALEEAIRQINTQKYSKADVLMISDFIMDEIDEQTEKSIQNCKENGTRFHSLVISSEGNPQALSIFDNNWIYNTKGNKPFKGILKNIRYINSDSTIEREVEDEGEIEAKEEEEED